MLASSPPNEQGANVRTRTFSEPASGMTATTGVISSLSEDSRRYHKLREELAGLLKERGIPAPPNVGDEDLVAVIRTLMKQ